MHSVPRKLINICIVITLLYLLQVWVWCKIILHHNVVLTLCESVSGLKTGTGQVQILVDWDVCLS